MLLRSSTSIVYMQNNYIVYSTDYLGANLDSLCLNSISLSLIIIVIGLSKQERNMISTFLKNKMK